MCIWCIRDGVFSDDDWNEMLHEKLREPSLIDRVKQFVCKKKEGHEKPKEETGNVTSLNRRSSF
ncbi:MAG: hypothetical protein ACOCXQ_01810 [Patescibacteria group bacterium]